MVFCRASASGTICASAAAGMLGGTDEVAAGVVDGGSARAKTAAVGCGRELAWATSNGFGDAASGAAAWAVGVAGAEVAGGDGVAMGIGAVGAGALAVGAGAVGEDGGAGVATGAGGGLGVETLPVCCPVATADTEGVGPCV